MVNKVKELFARWRAECGKRLGSRRTDGVGQQTDNPAGASTGGAGDKPTPTTDAKPPDGCGCGTPGCGFIRPPLKVSVPVVINEITEPSIYIVSHSQLTYDNDGQIELNRFLKENTNSGGAKQPYFFENPDNKRPEGEEQGELDPYDLDNIPEVAGRLCYMSFDKPRPGGNQTYLQHIRETGHGSVLEHSVIGFILTGVSRSLTHELVRHRAGFGYSQLSQRFVDHEPTADDGSWSFVCPLALLGRAKAHGIWLKAMRDSARAYMDLAEELSHDLDPSPTSGVPSKLPKLTLKQQREAARSVLPNSTETKIFVSCNMRALRHLFHMRGSIHADREIRRFARRLYDKIKDLDLCKELLADVTVSDDQQDVLTVQYPHL